VIAASIFVVAGAGNGAAGLSLEVNMVVRSEYGVYGYHTFQYEHWITAYRKVNANFKAIESHGTVS
jgi:hypothetical protein